MDLIKKLTGKNPAEYENVAKCLVDNSDVILFAKLVKQDDFLFDFVKNNVAKRIRFACNKDNYLNLMNFLKYYSPSYDTMIASVLYEYGSLELLPAMKEVFLNGSDGEKAYAAKYFFFFFKEYLGDLIPLLRTTAISDFDPLSANSIEVLAKVGDEISKNDAISRLNSEDEFERYNAVKFLVAYQDKDVLPNILEVMKKSTLSENIASEIPFLVPLEELIKTEDGILVLCNIINAIPEIISPAAVIDYELYTIFEGLIKSELSGASALLLRLAKDKFAELCANEEYLFDCDKNTKDEVNAINNLLSNINDNKLKNMLYEELYDGSDFVLFAVDYADEIEELEALLDTENKTLLLKVLSLLKSKQALKDSHKKFALEMLSEGELKEIVEAL